MKDQWRGNNVDLNKLSESIKQYFIQGQFETTMEKTQDKYKIDAATEKILNVQLKILVNLFGQPNDFTIEFTADKERKGFFTPSMIISYVATALGGGVFLRSEIKLKEALEKLEKMFWEHVDKKVAELTNSAA